MRIILTKEEKKTLQKLSKKTGLETLCDMSKQKDCSEETLQSAVHQYFGYCTKNCDFRGSDICKLLHCLDMQPTICDRILDLSEVEK